MKFRIWTILWVFALLASAMATFWVWGILWTLLITSFWAVVFRLLKMTFFEWLLCSVVIASLAIILQPSVSGIRPNVSRRNSCMNHIKELALAALAYQSEHGRLPQDIIDAHGKPLLSWRVQILPYLDEQALYESVHLDEPWDGPNNRKLWKEIPETLRCPGCGFANHVETVSCSPTATNYFAVTGSNTVWTESTRATWEELARRDRLPKDDGLFSLEPPKIMLVEAMIPTSCWMQPLDLSVEDALMVFRTNKRQGHLATVERFLAVSSVSLHTQVATVGGHVESIYNDINRDEVVQRLVVDDSMEVKWQQVAAQDASDADWVMFRYKWSRIYSLTLFLMLSLLPQLRRRDVFAELFRGDLVAERSQCRGKV